MSNRVVHAPERSRYELLAGDGGQLLGFVDYLPAGASVIVPTRRSTRATRARASAPSSCAAPSTRSAPRAGR